MKHTILSYLTLGLLVSGLSACQNTLEGLGNDMQLNGKKLAEYSHHLADINQTTH